jgi:hypothetical protein
MASLAAIVREGSSRLSMLWFRRREQSSLTALFESIAFPSDVHRRGVMQQAIEDRGRDDRVAPKIEPPSP